MKKVIIAGATGFIGYYLVSKLLEEKTEVWIVCRETSSYLERIKKIKGIHIIYCSLENILSLQEICEERDFDAFYDLAWSGAAGELRGCIETQLDNVKWTCNCMKAAQKLGCKKIIITGTICEKQRDSIVEKEEFVGSSYYLLAKKNAYEMCRCLSLKENIPFVWCRFYHPIGVYNKKNQLITNTIWKLLNHKELKFGSAQALFDVIAVEDLAEALYLMGELSLKKQSYFVGSGNPMYLKNYLELLKEIVDPYADMQYGALNVIDLPMKEQWLDIHEFQKETEFVPKYSFESSVRKIKRWLENEEEYDNKKWII